MYGLSILVGGISGFWLAVTTTSGTAATWGFGLLAIVWIGATAYGIASAIRGDIGAHQRWMIRSAALTMAAVTLRMYLGIGVVAGFPYEYIVGLLAWICWVPNLAVAEIIIRKPTFLANPIMGVDHDSAAGRRISKSFGDRDILRSRISSNIRLTGHWVGLKRAFVKCDNPSE
jgi:hypothetical protein